jgi:hypothetical protein
MIPIPNKYRGASCCIAIDSTNKFHICFENGSHISGLLLFYIRDELGLIGHVGNSSIQPPLDVENISRTLLIDGVDEI